MRIILNHVHYVMKINQAFPIFLRVSLKNTERPGYEASSYPLSLLKRESSGVDKASFISSSMVWLARCRIVVPLKLMGWSFAQACLAIDDLSV